MCKYQKVEWLYAREYKKYLAKDHRKVTKKSDGMRMESNSAHETTKVPSQVTSAFAFFFLFLPSRSQNTISNSDINTNAAVHI